MTKQLHNFIKYIVTGYEMKQLAFQL